MKNLYKLTVKMFVILSFVFLLMNTAQAATITSAQTGNWSATSTWVGGVVPASTDDAVIAAGHTVTYDEGGNSYRCNNLTINGTLQFPDDGSSYNLTVNSDLVVVSTGSLIPAASTTNSGGSWIYILGNLQILGSYSGHGSAGRSIYIEMLGNGKYIDASGKDIYSLTIAEVGNTINVNSSFSISNSLALYGTLNNSTHNITINSNVSIHLYSSTAALTAAPIFSGTSQTCYYYAAMTTGNELPDNFLNLYIQISGGGSVTLNKDVTVYHLIFQYANNTLTTGAHTITVTADGPGVYQQDNTTYVVGNLARSYSSTGSKIFPIGTATAYRPVTVNATSITGSGTITVFQTDAAPASNSRPGGVNKVSSVRYWTISKSAGITALTADVTLSWGADDGVSDPTKITVVHGDHSTGNWDAASGTGSGTASSGTVTGTGFTSFSDFTLGTTGSDPLPVELKAFSASVNQSVVTLNWQTATEVNNYGFEVERSAVSDQQSAISKCSG